VSANSSSGNGLDGAGWWNYGEVSSNAIRLPGPAGSDRYTASAAACGFYRRWLWEKRKRRTREKKRKNVAVKERRTAANGAAIARRDKQTDWQYFGEDGTMEKPAEK
jgi:hypothetical protein